VLAEPEPDPTANPSESDAGSEEARAVHGDGGTDDAGVITDAATGESDSGSADASADADPDAEETGLETGSPDAEFAGEFAGEDVSIIRIDGLPERTERDPKARTNVRQSADDRIEIILINSANGDPLCTMTADVSGQEAEVGAGQSCFGEGGSLTGTVASGKARIQGDHLTLDLDVDLELTLGPETRDGTIDYHFEGDRK
jgi:hypothetical protein